jgi:magnesium transporter
MADALKTDQLLWIDVVGRDPDDLQRIGDAVGLERSTLARLHEPGDRADLTQSPRHIHLVLQDIEVNGTDDATKLARSAGDPDAASLRRHSVDIVAGRDWVVTVHEGELPAFRRLDAATEGDTRLGKLDAASFVAAITDEILDDYLELVESIEAEIDTLDQWALRSPSDRDVLARIVRVRRRIGFIRRTLAPHRVAFAALARPDMALHDELGQPWPGLTDRLERALDAVENLRDLLLGTFDIHMGRAAQESNDIMKVLTLISAVLLPSVVLAGVMGMNFHPAFFDVPENFWIVVGAMAAFAVGLLGVARLRGWW